MKYAHAYQLALGSGDFPVEWQSCAISYKLLKKSIRKLQIVLSEFGQVEDNMRLFWWPDELGSVKQDQPNRVCASASDQQMSPLALSEHLTLSVQGKKGPVERAIPDGLELASLRMASDVSPHSTCNRSDAPGATIPLDLTLLDKTSSEKIRLLLTGKSGFLDELDREVCGLRSLLANEEKALTDRISKIGDVVSKAVQCVDRGKNSQLYLWREIFELYIESKIFFPVRQNGQRARSFPEARERLQWYCLKLEETGCERRLHKQGNALAMQQFIDLNLKLLANMKFQELNFKAVEKILKKFDKKTFSSTRQAFANLSATLGLPTSSLARSICSQIGEHVLASVPRISDYLCPVCFSISFKPIRLQCQHVFCIRCIISLQKNGTESCPLCRGQVVMKADSMNLDVELMGFLKAYFPVEVKAKQKQNEREAGIDAFGPSYGKGCLTM